MATIIHGLLNLAEPAGAHPATRRVSLQPRGNDSTDDLPAYSANPTYESVPHPQEVTRRVVRTHEKKVKRDLKDAREAENQCARIRKILPQIYEQLNAACEAPMIGTERTGPAALRPVQESRGIKINFTSRGISQKALRHYLPLLLADYQREMAAAQASATVDNHAAQWPMTETTPMSPSRTDSSSDLSHMMTVRSGSSTTQSQQSVTSSSSSHVRTYHPDKLSVKAGYFEDYSQKIYFSRRFVNLWKKQESGKRDNVASGIAMILIGMKIGLPVFDLITFAAIDVPRLALQGVTGKQTLKLAD